MTETPAKTSGRVTALAALSLSGADAIGFAQRICANDVAALAVGQWQWNCVLSPQGRVLALFRLWRRDDDVLMLVLPAFVRDSTSALLKRYLLRAKVVLTNVDVDLIGGSFMANEPESAVMQADNGRWLGLAGARNADLVEYPDLSDDWRARDLAEGIPWLDPDATETFTPQALSLDRLGAFSVRKGCYPGQEIVARMHFLGQNKRGLRRFAAPQNIAVGASLYAAGSTQRALGTVVMVASGPTDIEILAVVQGAAGDEPLFATATGELPLRALPFEAPPLPAPSAPLAKP